MNTQELIIGHVLPIAATVAVLWLVYRLLFRNSNQLYFNRYFLLTSMLLALAMPLLGLLSGMEVPQMATLKQNMFNGIMLSEVIVTPDGQPMLPEVTVTTDATPSRFSLWQVIVGIYLIGVGVMTLLFLFKLAKLVVLIIRSPKQKMNGCTAVFTGREQGSFSFFRYAFFPNENVDPDIMRHEMSHIEHHHSWDILFTEVMMILQWFNPFIYLYKKELQSLHEYMADRDVVATGVDKKNYMMLILQQCTAVDFSGMSNNFSLILTKKRIKMITRNEKAKGLWWRLLATLPVLAVLLIANTKVTAQEQKTNDKLITVEMGAFEIYDDDGFPMQLKDTLIYNEDGTYVKFETSDDFDPMTGEPRKKMSITTHNADGTISGTITNLRWEMHGDTALYTAEPFSISADKFRFDVIPGEDNPVQIIRNDNDTIYQVVDEMPMFPGGEAAMMKFVSNNVKYPQEAKDNDISGRVFISFVVEKDGSVSNVKVMRGIGGGCDEEAVRVISSMPKWKPGIKDGKPVRVSYMMPLTFKLTEGQPAKSAPKVDASQPDMKPDKDGVYQTVEEMPEFPGGVEALIDYVGKNVKYPESAKKNNLQGRVIVKFVIEKDGTVTNVEVGRGWGNELDEEAVRVVKAMPKWKPGKQDGKTVRVSYMLPINFILGNEMPPKGPLMGTTWIGTGTGKKGNVTYEMDWTVDFTDGRDGLIMMTLWSKEKNGDKKSEFDDVPLPFEYTYDGKSTGSINPVNPDNTPMGEDQIPPYGFVISSDNTMRINLFDMKEEFGIGEIVLKKQ